MNPKAQLKKYSKMLEYHNKNPIGHQTAIKHLEIKIRELKTFKEVNKFYSKQQRKNKPMNHTKTLEEQEETHKVVTLELDEQEVEEFRGSKKACQSYINQSNLITLEIKPICE